MQIFKLTLSKQIASDIRKIAKYLPPPTCDKLIQEINIKFCSLKVMPKMYQRLFYDEKKGNEYRRAVCRKYIIIYKIHKNEVTILRILSEKIDYLKSGFIKF